MALSAFEGDRPRALARTATGGSNVLTRVDAPSWARSVVLQFAGADGKVAHAGTDGAGLGAGAYQTIPADTPVRIPLSEGRDASSRASLFVTSATAAVTFSAAAEAATARTAGLFAGAGGSSAAPWNPLLSVNQGSGASVAPFDPGGFRASGGFNTATGRMDIVCAAHVANVVGYNQALMRYDEELAALMAGYDPVLDVIELGARFASFPLGTTELGFFFYIGDRNTADVAGLNAAMLGVQQTGTGTQHLATAQSGAGLVDTRNCGEVIELRAIFDGLLDTGGAAYRFNGNSSVRNAGGGVTETVNGTRGSEVPPAMSTTIANHVLGFGLFHQSTDSIVGLQVTADIFWRRFRRATYAFP